MLTGCPPSTDVKQAYPQRFFELDDEDSCVIVNQVFHPANRPKPAVRELLAVMTDADPAARATAADLLSGAASLFTTHPRLHAWLTLADECITALPVGGAEAAAPPSGSIDDAMGR